MSDEEQSLIAKGVYKIFINSMRLYFFNNKHIFFFTFNANVYVQILKGFNNRLVINVFFFKLMNINRQSECRANTAFVVTSNRSPEQIYGEQQRGMLRSRFANLA